MTALRISPKKFADDRGWFCETYSIAGFADLGISTVFCQDNHSLSVKAGTLRGIHFQTVPHAQAKLVRCTRGRIYDVAVDLRAESPSFGKWVAAELSAANGQQLFVPAGYGHAFLTLEDDSEVQYKVDAYYAPQSDAGVRWDDPALAIDWPLAEHAIPSLTLSDKDAQLPFISDLQLNFPYDGRPLLPLN
jgi:dTDP-4-dehydrorhamnose 3,5-epimerase